MRLARTPAAACAAAAVLLALPAGASAQTKGTGENITHVKNLRYPDLHNVRANRPIRDEGTDIEFARIGDKRYAFAGSYNDGMHIIDITVPERSERVATWDCGMSQADPQVFRRKDMPGRVFVTSTMDDGYTFHKDSKCVADLAEQGIEVTGGGLGTFIADVTDPTAPYTVGFIPFRIENPRALFSEGASHNGTIHPSGLYFYNSDSDLMDSVLNEPPAIEVFDIRDFRNPVLVDKIPLKTVPGLGTESHDITFNKKGTRAYSAALSHGAVIDTTDPTNNKNIGTIIDPAINVWHQADPYTVTDASGRERTFVIAEDEFAGAAGGPVCPSGGFHVYEITGELEKDQQKVGYWNIDDVDTTDAILSCTAHVFDIHEDEKIMTIAYYNGGVHVVDLSGLTGISLAGQQVVGEGMKGVGYYRIQGMDAWSAKTPKIGRNGSFYLYGNDVARGLDVYKFDGTGAKSQKKGKWMGAAEAKAYFAGLPKASVTKDNALVCLLPQD